MENWGLIILHSDNVRISNSDSTLPINDDFIDSSKEEKIKEQKNIQRQNLIEIDKLAERYKIEKLITHELIHQWFGNLGKTFFIY